MNQFKTRYITGRRKQAGVTLLIIIIAMLVVAVLGIAIYALTYTATLNQVVAQRAARAFYLSESGIRIAASEYTAATAANNVNTKMPQLHNKTFILPDNVSTVQIQIYPYWLYATTDDVTASTSATLYLHLPGGIPAIDDTDTLMTFPANGLGLLKIEDARVGRSPAWVGNPYSTTVAHYNTATIGAFNAASGTQVTFTLSPSFPDSQNQIITGDEFYIGSDSYTTAQAAVNPGDALILNVASTDTNDATAKIFPPQRGTLFVATLSTLYQYSYDSRIITTTSTPHTVTLTNLRILAGAWAPLTVTSGTQIYVGKSLGFRSASTFGD